MKANTITNGVAVRHVTVKGQPMVMLPERDFERLVQQADAWEPALPPRDADGHYPAVEYAQVSLALKIIRQRRRLGLSQAELARRAGIRPATLHRIEEGKTMAGIAAVDKIETALKAAEALVKPSKKQNAG